MAGRLKQFVKKTKDKKDEEAKRQKEVVEQALSLVPRCELNENLPETASKEDLWKAIQKNFEWNFGPSKGKSLKDTKTQFLKWAVRKLKDPVRTMCQIELMIREKKTIEESSPPQGVSSEDSSGEAAIDAGSSEGDKPGTAPESGQPKEGNDPSAND